MARHYREPQLQALLLRAGGDPDRLKKDGIPCIVIEGDMADDREFSEGGWRTRVGAFLEGSTIDRGRKR